MPVTLLATTCPFKEDTLRTSMVCRNYLQELFALFARIAQAIDGFSDGIDDIHTFNSAGHFVIFTYSITQSSASEQRSNHIIVTEQEKRRALGCRERTSMNYESLLYESSATLVVDSGIWAVQCLGIIQEVASRDRIETVFSTR